MGLSEPGIWRTSLGKGYLCDVLSQLVHSSPSKHTHTYSSVGKESACNAGDPSWIPGSERTAGEEGYPLQYSWVSLVVQLVNNPPAMLETWVQSLGWEDPLEKGKVTN